MLWHKGFFIHTATGSCWVLGESVHVAGTVCGGTKLVVAALWVLRPGVRIDKQTRLIVRGASRGARVAVGHR
jgi:hypothetical protein